MKLYPDDPNSPDIPFEPPPELENLRDMADDIRKVLKSKEDIHNLVVQSAEEAAREYIQNGGTELNECVAMVSMAINLTGGVLGGEIGKTMANESHDEAAKACKRVLQENS